jgi:ketosteroid isomerase-like protein
MSSESEAEVVRRFQEGWMAEDLDVVLECVHPEMEFDWSESRAPFRGIYRAHDGMRRYWDDVREAWEWFRPEIEEVIDCGDGRLVTPTTVRGRARASGIELKARGTMLWVVRGGKIVRGKLFQTTEEAMEAARQAD